MTLSLLSHTRLPRQHLSTPVAMRAFTVTVITPRHCLRYTAIARCSGDCLLAALECFDIAAVSARPSRRLYD
ncbi:MULTISPECIES: hypothetical protein [unclassified Undibacterium]|uniref:hypothetical protein n=1 Tax=unclassified Undibacterium TaxID=2630295 RepID=UPI002AC9360A|nr:MULTISPECIES: hypothetical protein [unclassified Undibacterium]MEB0137972.1 hypothetical protein [Undibacterium sp. CCC2.1]MEB0170695.1 hypothetical protein [Undibacterium sp. CCC1.1]MEB0177036.1 hypothetical protein [Undibacterium sp. CCC3.4]MEB0216325.1 hypothetical protein [Undibacterium sp. 5I2]WPX42509.1 hypothetical protein RHM61_14070 [Undibacterium sp. CCC3.4]